MSFKVEHIVKYYGSYLAVDDLSFTIEKPGVFALLGTNGAGKTTAIRIILGMLSKNSGKVTWNGEPFSAVGGNVGYLAEERGLYPKYNILEQMRYFASLKGMKRNEADKAIDYWFEKLQIEQYKEKKAEQLSKGNQQKVQLAAALISDPEIIILDEPLSGLDPVNADIFKGIIREEINKDKYIIMSSHQMSAIEEFCEDIIIIKGGKTVLSGNLNQIKRGYGRVNLTVKADGNFLPAALSCGLTVIQTTPNGTDFRLSDEAQAQELLKRIISDNIPLVKFELREPSLHEIFIEKAGGNPNEN